MKPASPETVPTCSHGRPMIPAGPGAYPYECPLSVECPGWVVYYNDPGCPGDRGRGCACWDVSPDHEARDLARIAAAAGR